MSALTDAQKRALLWLPADGGWKTIQLGTGRTIRSIGPALRSVRLFQVGLIDEGGYRTERGAWRTRHRLTPAGIEARKQVERVS